MVIFVAHISDDDLERYAMQTLPDSETVPLEEHLLICSECRDLLESTGSIRGSDEGGGGETQAITGLASVGFCHWTIVKKHGDCGTFTQRRLTLLKKRNGRVHVALWMNWIASLLG
jgi:hypothetical protein